MPHLSLPKTYDIDVRAILSRRKGQYDLEDEFLWFYEYITQDDSGWTEKVKSRLVTLSEDPQISRIVLDCPNIELINQKQNFARICRGEPWMPPSVILHLDSRGSITPRSREDLEELLSSTRTGKLLFLKKAGHGIGGGFDVTPLISPTVGEVEEAILKQNQTGNPRYRRSVFILQEGVQHPLVTALGQKTDIRLYMLIVGRSDTRQVEFYACKVGDIRNTAAYPYDPSSVDTRLQITNVAQNSAYAKDKKDITRVFSRETMPEYYDGIFKKFIFIVKRIATLYEPNLSDTRGKYFVTLIGLDAVIDTERDMSPMIVELNRRPTVYTPSEARRMNYSSSLFMRDVFELGVQAIADGDIGSVKESEYFIKV